MGLRDQEAIPYLNSATETISSLVPDNRVSRDEEDYDTLKAVCRTLEDALEALYSDFNAFAILENAPKSTALYDLLKQIEAKKMAYDILLPTLEAVRGSVQGVDNKYKEL